MVVPILLCLGYCRSVLCTLRQMQPERIDAVCSVDHQLARVVVRLLAPARFFHRSFGCSLDRPLDRALLRTIARSFARSVDGLLDRCLIAPLIDGSIANGEILKTSTSKE